MAEMLKKVQKMKNLTLSEGSSKINFLTRMKILKEQKKWNKILLILTINELNKIVFIFYLIHVILTISEQGDLIDSLKILVLMKILSLKILEVLKKMHLGIKKLLIPMGLGEIRRKMISKFDYLCF